ncbi:cysteine/serine endopeptidase inhibitor [Kitasatospora sp. NPDC001603]|uniref:cysteine/serine endopeptidase inhibitor n=1 Tax=Kitasatospora sp. NPDC001603 TaxID=3154388 RepID=UPI00332137E8
MDKSRRRKWPSALLATAAIMALGTGPAVADSATAQSVQGRATYYNDAGYGACGTQIDASREFLVAVPAAYWTSPNPNNDRLCRGVWVRVTYQGRTITVPVADKCPSCDSSHIDLSLPAFQQLADPNVGVINVQWEFVGNWLGQVPADHSRSGK